MGVLKKTAILLFLFFLTDAILRIFGVEVLAPLSMAFLGYINLLLPPMLLGIFIGSLLEVFVPEHIISRVLASKRKRNVIYSVFLGFLASACSHGMLAISMALYRKGASISAVVSFLLASPWANMPMTVLLVSLFGFKGIIFVLSAILIALVTGFIFLELENSGFIKRKEEFRISHQKCESCLVSRGKSFISSFKILSEMVLPWIFLGAFFAAFFHAYVPTQIFKAYLGPSPLGLFFTLLLATVMEVCSEGTAPLAFEIYRKTGAFGNAFVFLMAGVVTDYTEIATIWANIGKRAAILLPLITVPQTLLLGYLFNLCLAG